MKIIKVLCGIIFFGGLLLLWGAFGGLEKDLCTQAEFWRMCGIAFMMIVIGGIGSQSKEEED